MGNEQLTRGMWEYFTIQRAEGKRIRDDAAGEKQEGIQGQWQQESPFREILEKARRHEDMGCSSEILRKGHFAIRDSRWEEFEEECREILKSSEWVLGTIREAYEKVVKEEAGRLSIVREILRQSTDFLRRIIAPVGGSGGVTLSYICIATVFLFGGPHLVGIDRTWRQEALRNLWRKIMNGEHPTRFW